MIEFVAYGRAVSENVAYATKVYPNGKHHRYLTSEGRKWKEFVGWCAKHERVRHEAELRLDDNYHLTLEVYFNDNRRRDLSNFEKLIYDSMIGIFYNDDKQILSHTAMMCIGEPKVKITLQAYERTK